MPDFSRGQFPSLDGDPESEVNQRTAENNSTGSVFRKVFTVHNRSHTLGLPKDHWVHWQNAVAVLQEAIQRGLHPKGAPVLVDEQPHPTAPGNTNLTYEVPVTPAVSDTEPHTTVTPSSLVSPQAYAAALAAPNAVAADDGVHELVEHTGEQEPAAAAEQDAAEAPGPTPPADSSPPEPTSTEPEPPASDADAVPVPAEPAPVAAAVEAPPAAPETTPATPATPADPAA
jgi:hypothetical protein